MFSQKCIYVELYVYDMCNIMYERYLSIKIYKLFDKCNHSFSEYLLCASDFFVKMYGKYKMFQVKEVYELAGRAYTCENMG